ncbi:hypothetical protein [Streptomyces sp. BBFR109]|uniref:hypothetical protein n=1 Tax=Streptomyces sp. BBFR109 TaxID=3448172 RepID=UPI003F76F6E0
MLAATVLALTGFSRGHGHSHSGHGGSGGGCSSSHQDHDSTSSSTSGGGSAYDDTDDTYGDADADDDEDSYGTGGSSSGGSSNRRPGYRSTPSASGTASGGDLAAGKVRLVSCATQKAPYATVEVSNPNGAGARFTAFVEFRDAEDESVAYRSAEVTVPADGTARVRVPLDDGGVKDDGLIHEVDHCAPDPTAPPLDD